MFSWGCLPSHVNCRIDPAYRLGGFKRTRGGLITGFTTGNLFVVLPVLIEDCKELFRDTEVDDKHASTYVDVLIPVSFNFPNAGKLVMLLFVSFAAWFDGSNLSILQMPTFVISGLLSFFGSVNIGVPFMLDLFKLPADLFQFFVVSGVMTGYFATLLAAMSLITITLLGTASMTGHLRVRMPALLRWAGLNVAGLVAMLIGLSVYFNFSVENEYEKSAVLGRMHSSIMADTNLNFKLHEQAPDSPSATSTWERLHNQGVIRIGVVEGAVPFSFFNAKGDLVGLDIDLALLFASDMKVYPEVVLAQNIPELQKMLQNDIVDIAFSTQPVLPRETLHINYSDTLFDMNLALVVEDTRVDDFSSMEAISEQRFGYCQHRC